MRKIRHVSVGALNAQKGFNDPYRMTPNAKLPLNESMMALSEGMSLNVGREKYLSWVAAWKRLYAEVSEVIRNLKDYRDGRAAGIGGNSWEAIRGDRQSDVAIIKRYATWLLNLRKINKVLAGLARANNPKPVAA